MREYDSNLPLIVIHIPKTGGSSVKEVFEGWFGENLHLHYFHEPSGSMPRKYDLLSMHKRSQPLVIYGHFNRDRGFGVEDYYPDAKQFITFLRDPFEQIVSGYFFARKVGKNWADQSRVPKGELRDFILKTKASSLAFFPRKVTIDNYKDIIETFFIEIGVTEHLEESMIRIADKICKPYEPGTLNRLNVTKKDQMIPYELKEEFMENRPLDYAVYNYVLDKYTQQKDSTGTVNL